MISWQQFDISISARQHTQGSKHLTIQVSRCLSTQLPKQPEAIGLPHPNIFPRYLPVAYLPRSTQIDQTHHAMPADSENPHIDPRIFQSTVVDPALQELPEPQAREASSRTPKSSHDDLRFPPEEEVVCLFQNMRSNLRRIDCLLYLSAAYKKYRFLGPAARVQHPKVNS